MKKIVFLDIDGTICSYDGFIPPSTRDAVRVARGNGHLLFICSGRSVSLISGAVLSIGFDGVISSGGAHIEADGRVIQNNFMSAQTFRHICEYLDAREIAYVIEQPFATLGGPFMFPFLEKVRADVQGTDKEGSFAQLYERTFSSMTAVTSDFLPDGVSKIVFTDCNGVPFEEIRAEFDGECEVFRGSVPFLGAEGGEISPVGVHKGAAVARVVEYFGMSREDSIAVGDGDNDRKMIEYAGVGIAMGNGDEAIKKIADYVTDSLELDGLAKAFKRYGLI